MNIPQSDMTERLHFLPSFMTSNITCANQNSSFTNFLKSYKCINNTAFIPLFKCEKSWRTFSFFLNFFFFKSPKLPIYFLKSLLESQLLCHSVHNHLIKELSFSFLYQQLILLLSICLVRLAIQITEIVTLQGSLLFTVLELRASARISG